MYRQKPQGNSVIRFTLALLLTDANDESKVVVVSVDWDGESELMVVSVSVEWDDECFLLLGGSSVFFFRNLMGNEWGVDVKEDEWSGEVRESQRIS